MFHLLVIIGFDCFHLSNQLAGILKNIFVHRMLGFLMILLFSLLVTGFWTVGCLHETVPLSNNAVGKWNQLFVHCKTSEHYPNIGWRSVMKPLLTRK